MCENGRFETQVKLFLQIFETLFGSLKDENKILKKDQGKSFKTFYKPDLAYLK
jgi:hypothetical protein